MRSVVRVHLGPPAFLRSKNASYARKQFDVTLLKKSVGERSEVHISAKPMLHETLSGMLSKSEQINIFAKQKCVICTKAAKAMLCVCRGADGEA